MSRVGDDCARWFELMRHGRFAEAWAVTDRALAARAGIACVHLPRHVQWIWDGTPLDGKRVLVRCYHGLGDTIQFIRYARLIKAVAAEVIVWVQPRLIPLLRGARGIDRLLPLHDGAPQTHYDVDVELMELPHVFRTVVETIPADVPYLDVPAAARPAGDGIAVGVAWRSGDWDERRDLPFELVGRLARLEGARFYSLQKDRRPAEGDPRIRGVAGIDDPAGTARVMKSLDLVISVDTMAAHLAGALGVPVWTLLQREPDWRWMIGRDDTPWYPTMRLFRTDARTGREGLVERVRGALGDLLTRAPRARHVARERRAASSVHASSGASSGRR